ncbi:MAG: DNA/RNA non-specific endonuclease [Clostridia bacterium]|nr:DNA/RNA non-specific endonuclease [Clostridia bacterium]
MLKKIFKIISIILSVLLLLICSQFIKFGKLTKQNELFALYSQKSYSSIENIPEYKNDPFVIINDNKPFFTDRDLVKKSFEKYSELDSLGRCGTAMACVGVDIMPTKERGNIGMIRPTGWHTVKYDIVDGKYLYNRCHLIGYQLTGENANPQNLITGTRYFNNEGMLPFEDLIAEYVKETENHVLYRVTPIFKGKNLLASGVLMEAKSVEDNGKEICFNVYVYNVHPDITIDYLTGYSYYGDKPKNFKDMSYVLNTNSKKIHTVDCSSVAAIDDKNKKTVDKTVEELIKEGFTPCKQCNP